MQNQLMLLHSGSDGFLTYQRYKIRNEDDISTNLAVDYTKKTLTERLKLTDWK